MKPRAMRMEPFFYLTSPSSFGKFAIVWREPAEGPKILQVYLPDRKTRLEDSVREQFSLVEKGSQPLIDRIAADIRRYLQGEVVEFDLKWLDWNQPTAFQARVLRAEFGIPRGWVSTYGRIAKHLNIERGARAVGGALAANPFPLLIPCHRAVRSSGALGGYQGGLSLKKALLEMEGVAFRSPTRVSLDKVFYQVG